MGIWTETVEYKASIIHAQMAEARRLALANSCSAEKICEPYLKLLRDLYADEFPFAQLTDSSDLVARFTGPSVDVKDPAVSIVISVFSDLRGQIRSIAKSIVGLASDTQLKWPAHLDPHLSGITHGSLIVGVSVVSPKLGMRKGQQELEGVSDQLFNSVVSAVRGLSSVAKYIGDHEIDKSISEEFPDPAIRDMVLVAAKRLAPSGRRGIEAVSFYSPDTKEKDAIQLTSRSRYVITSSLNVPVQKASEGNFEGIVREVDLDARRLEIRNVSGIGSIRCAYSDRHDIEVKKALDTRIKISGRYESLPSGRPRMVAIETLEFLAFPPEQLSLDDES